MKKVERPCESNICSWVYTIHWTLSFPPKQEEELSETKIRIGLLEKKVEAAELEVCLLWNVVCLSLCLWNVVVVAATCLG